jgi:hypothetical protein
MKFLHKFYSKADIPWVHLVWGNYYANGRLFGQQVKGSFWWRDIVNLITPYKGMASVTVQNGSSVLAWYDLWNGHLLQHEFPQLFSFVKNPNSTVQTLFSSNNLALNFHLPLFEEAHSQFLLLHSLAEDLHLSEALDQWSYIWGNNRFSAARAYKVLIGHRQVHLAFHWIWNSKCQMKQSFLLVAAKRQD